MSSEREISIRANLQEPHATWFEELKHDLQYESNADTIRYAIQHAWKQVKSDQNEYIALPNQVNKEIEAFVNRSDVQSQYHLHSVDEFVKKAIYSLLDDLKHEKDKSILHFEVRQHLSDEELELAIAFEQCMERDQGRGVTADQVTAYMNRRDTNTIQHGLDKFVDQHLLTRIKKFDIILYRASL